MRNYRFTDEQNKTFEETIKGLVPMACAVEEALRRAYFAGWEYGREALFKESDAILKIQEMKNELEQHNTGCGVNGSENDNSKS